MSTCKNKNAKIKLINTIKKQIIDNLDKQENKVIIYILLNYLNIMNGKNGVTYNENNIDNYINEQLIIHNIKKESK
jgi:hypothetical protein